MTAPPVFTEDCPERDAWFAPGNDAVWGPGRWVKCAAARCVDGVGLPAYHHRNFHRATDPLPADVWPGKTYARPVLVDVLVHHWRTDTAGCGCGWAELGRSHPEHVADVYEQTVLGVTFCAGRSAVAHDRTPMVDGACPVCGEEEGP